MTREFVNGSIKEKTVESLNGGTYQVLEMSLGEKALARLIEVAVAGRTAPDKQGYANISIYANKNGVNEYGNTHYAKVFVKDAK